MVGGFKSTRVFSYFQHSGCFSYIIVISYYVYTYHALVQLVADVYYRYWDLGSITRSPTSLMIFFFIRFHAASHPKEYHTPNACACQMSQGINPRVKVWRLSCTLSQPHVRKHRKSMWPDFSGPNCFPKPPNWVNTPHVCISFSHSFSLFLFICFDLFVFI